MKPKETYEEAKLEIVCFEQIDIITSSNIQTGGSDMSDETWTPIGW